MYLNRVVLIGPASERHRSVVRSPADFESPFSVGTSPRVCHVVTSSLSVRFLRGQLAFMRALGFEMYVISAPGPELRTISDEGAPGIEVGMEREIHPMRDLRSLWRLRQILRSIRPHILVAATPKGGLLGMVAAYLTGVPVRIYNQWGMRLETTGGLKRAVLWASERLASACATQVICVSESLRQRYVELGLAPLAKTVVLGAGSSHGVDAERFRPNTEAAERGVAIRRAFRIPLEAPVVGFVGRLTRDKGIVELLEVFERLLRRMPDVRLLLVGDFEMGDPVPPEIVRRLQDHPQVAIAGFVEVPDPYYHAMDVVAHPSHREGFPNVPLEAAAAELPVVGFRVTGTVDAVQDGVTGTLVPIGDVDAMSDALFRYLRSPELRRVHGRAGRERVVREFRPERVWGLLVEEYRRLLEAAGFAPPQCPSSERLSRPAAEIAVMQ